MELIIKNDQGHTELDFASLESIVRNDELLNELKRIFVNRRRREINAIEIELDDKGFTIDAYVGGSLYKIYYWIDNNLYSINRFGSVDAMDLLEKAGRMVRHT